MSSLQSDLFSGYKAETKKRKYSTQFQNSWMYIVHAATTEGNCYLSLEILVYIGLFASGTIDQ